MYKLALTLLALVSELGAVQIDPVAFEFSTPTIFNYRRHYVESYSTGVKIFDLATPVDAKITLSSSKLAIDAGFNLKCDYIKKDDITIDTNDCIYNNANTVSDLAKHVQIIYDEIKVD